MRHGRAGHSGGPRARRGPFQILKSGRRDDLQVADTETLMRVQPRNIVESEPRHENLRT